MKTKITILFFIIFIIAIGMFAVIISNRLNSDRSVEYNYQADIDSVSLYDKVLKFAGGSDFSPFAYLDQNGNPCGHDVELAFAIGRELGYKVEVTLGDWTAMQEGLLNGTYDILITVDYSEERSKIMGYTSPVCLDSYVYFGKDSSINLTDLKDLQNIKIASLAGGGATDNYLVPMGLLGNTTFYDTQVEAFESVLNGENDVAIAGYIYGSNIIANYDMDLKQVGSPLYGSAYYFTYNITNTTLGPLLDSAIASLEAKGEITRISEKWTTHYQPNLTLGEYLSRNINTVIFVAVVFIFFILIVAAIINIYIKKKENYRLQRNPLTGLYNMSSFLEHMKKIINKEMDKQYILARFDMNNFKSFNLTQGFNVGNLLLKNIGQSIIDSEKTFKDILLTGYVGTDHFVLLLEKGELTNNPKLIHTYLSGIIEKINPEYNLTVKIGLCEIDNHCEDLGIYFERVLMALRSVKHDYENSFAWYDKKFQDKIDEEKKVTDKMFAALENGRFVPFFQPQYDYNTGKICSAEVLVRWIEEDGSVVPPNMFIPIFEKNGFIYEMDKAIWKQACECINKWKQEGIMIGHISVNISRVDIYHNDLIETLQNLLETYNVTPNEIHFEITESVYLENSFLLKDKVNRIKAFGGHIEMDDFGSGYSSLSSLKEIEFDTVKLDMSLIRNNKLTGKDATLLSSVVSLVKSMDYDIIAEGVELQAQADFLNKAGCNIMQGYLYSKPIDQASFEELLRKEK